jgi:hypothetical protein
MTKARDLANASTALSAVSATELAFVDGVTSAIQTQLDAKAATASTVSTAGGSTVTVASGTTVPLTIQNNGTGNSLVVNDEATDTSNLVIDASGNVGIGTSSPAIKSQISQTNTTSINGGTYLGLGKSENGVGGYRLIGFGYNPTTNYYPSALGYVETANNAGTAGDLIFLTRGQGNADTVAPTERMRIDAAGNVGVGKTATTKLDVNGTVNATAFTVGGAALPSSAMTLISRVSIGNTASVTLDNVFTSAYTNYLLVIDNWFALGTTDDLLIRYRTGGSSGTDASSNHYSGSTSNQFQGTTWVNYNVTTAAAFPLVTSSDTTNGIQAVLHFNNIGYASTYGHVFGNGINGSNQTYFNFMGYNAAGATYTGLRFNSTSSNIYLKASLYGLANS